MFTWVASAWTTAGRKNDLRLLARSAQLREQVFVDALRILIDGVDEPRAIGPLAHDRVRDVEVVEPGDQLPLLAVQAPHLVLFPLRHGRVSRVCESFILNAKGRRMAGPLMLAVSGFTPRFHPLPARARA